MLQIGCGLSVAQVSTLLLEPAETVSQRIVRAKKKIREAGIEPVLPTDQEVGERVSMVLTVVYALLLLSQDRPHAEDQMSLASEVLWLARSLAELCPDQPEVLGLHSLACLLESRRKARRTSAGVDSPLADQSEADWDWKLIAEGENALRKAATFSRLGRFQLEAAIQSVIIAERATGERRAHIVLRLYTELHRQFPTAGSHLGLIEAVWRNLGPEMALQELMGDRFSREYLPY
jgi:RNA polymerase sigma-70 factor (ECF subfamily)